MADVPNHVRGVRTQRLFMEAAVVVVVDEGADTGLGLARGEVVNEPMG